MNMNSLFAKLGPCCQKHKRTLLFAVIFLFGPLITAFGVGYELKAGVMKNIPFAVLDQDNSEFSRTIITYVEESDVFVLYDYADSTSEMEQWLKEGLVFAGIVIPAGLSADVASGNAPQILLAYDGSAMMVASSARTAMSEVLLTLKAAYLKNFYEGKLAMVPDQALNNALPIDLTYRFLYNPSKNFSNYFLLGMLIALLQIELAILGVERSRIGKQTITGLLRKCLGLGILGLFSLVVFIGVLCLWFDLPYRGSLGAGLVLSLVYALCMVSLGVLLGQIIPDRVFASQVTAFFVLPSSILGGYSFPLLAMPDFFQNLAAILPYRYYGEAMRNLCLKGLDFSHTLPYLKPLLIFIIIEALLICLVVCLKKLVSAKINRKAGEAL